MSKPNLIIDLFSQDVPELLYHYTNMTGLMGIIKSRQIWTTKIQYLNDKSELKLAFDYIRYEINQQIKGIGKNQSDEELNNKISALNGIDTLNISVASFTEEGDQLSQWRGYTEFGNGYSLGFYGQELKNRAEKLGYYLVPCIYDKPTHRELIRELINSTRVENNKANPNYNKPPFYKLNFSEATLLIAPIIKSEAFIEEKEWRLISPTLNYENASFRSGTKSLIPYWTFGIHLEKTLSTIIIGPTPEEKLSELALVGYVVNQLGPLGIDFEFKILDNIETSKVPFRKF
jgi:hypothetical protein